MIYDKSQLMDNVINKVKWLAIVCLRTAKYANKRSWTDAVVNE